jgi:hypothetical protein
MNPISFMLCAGAFLSMQEPTVPKSSLEECIRALHKGMESETEEDQLKALRAVLPTRKDIEILFPKDVEKLWPPLDQGLRDMEKNVSKVAKELRKGGRVTEVKTINIRTGREAESYKDVLEMIPKEIPAFDYSIKKEDGASGGGTYLYVQERWIFLRGLEGIPKFLKKQK